MRISQKGLDLIMHFEGFEAKPYICSGGKNTIGFGHVILPSEKFTLPITRAQGLEILASDVQKFEDMVEKMVKVEMTQGQFDALVSFTFNVGPANLQKSTLLRKINAKDATASDEFGKWVFAAGKPLPGLVKRRGAEAKLFRGESWNS